MILYSVSISLSLQLSYWLNWSRGKNILFQQCSFPSNRFTPIDLEQKYEAEVLPRVRHRILSILKIWIDLHPSDWTSLSDLSAFEQVVPNEPQIQVLKRHLKMRLEALKQLQTNIRVLENTSGHYHHHQQESDDPEIRAPLQSIQDGGLYLGLSIVNFDPVEIAQQMSLIDFDYFAAIPLCQFTRCGSSESGPKTPPFELCRMIQHSNRVVSRSKGSDN